MQATKKLPDLIEQVYDAALEPALWNDVIVSINDRLREVAWSYNDDGSLSGTTDDHYFRLTAYTMTAAGEPRRTTILCPYAIGFDARRVHRAIK